MQVQCAIWRIHGQMEITTETILRISAETADSTIHAVAVTKSVQCTTAESSDTITQNAETTKENADIDTFNITSTEYLGLRCSKECDDSSIQNDDTITEESTSITHTAFENADASAEATDTIKRVTARTKNSKVTTNSTKGVNFITLHGAHPIEETITTRHTTSEDADTTESTEIKDDYTTAKDDY